MTDYKEKYHMHLSKYQNHFHVKFQFLHDLLIKSQRGAVHTMQPQEASIMLSKTSVTVDECSSLSFLSATEEIHCGSRAYSLHQQQGQNHFWGPYWLKQTPEMPCVPLCNSREITRENHKMKMAYRYTGDHLQSYHRNNLIR